MAEERKFLHESSTGQLLVGVFVAVATVGFVWLLMSLRQGPETYRLVAEFDALGSSISEATVVKLRGFPVGKVDGVDFRPSPAPGEPYFLVRLGIEKAYPVPEGTVAEIRGGGLVGEAQVHLDVTAAGRGVLEPGAHLPGRSDETMKTLMVRLREAAQSLGGAGNSLKDADFGGKLGSMGQEVSRLVDDLGRVSLSADSLLLVSRHMVDDMRPGVRSSLENLDRTMARLALTMSRTDTLVAATSQDVRSSVRALRDLVERLDQVLGRVDTLVQHKESEIDATVTNLHATSAALREISESPWKLLIGKGDGRVAEEMGASSEPP